MILCSRDHGLFSSTGGLLQKVQMRCQFLSGEFFESGREAYAERGVSERGIVEEGDGPPVGILH